LSDGFKPFDAALLVRDALLSCSCCADEAEGQERYSASHDLLEWVVQVQGELAGLRALVGGTAPSRNPLSDAERAKAYRARKRVTKTVTERHENRHAAVTQAVTVVPPSQTLPPEEKRPASQQNLSENEEGKNARSLASDAREAVTDIVTNDVTSRDVSKTWHATIEKPGGNPGAMHAHNQWRADYETVASVINAIIVAERRQEALRVLCEWFWLAGDGPVRDGRLKPRHANPGHLAKFVSSDLDRAMAWHEQQEAAQ
jgi:hypothetical protein